MAAMNSVNSTSGHFEELLSGAVRVLQEKGTVLHPTETCYGLTADIFSQTAVEKVYQLKEMSLDKPVSIMVESFEQAQEYGVFDERARRLAEAFWPGPLTIIVRRSEKLPSYINPAIESVGLRCPGHNFTLAMLREFGGPLITTSANRTKEPQAYDVETFLGGRTGDALPEFVVDLGLIPETAPSTIVDLSGSELRVVRQGPISITDIEQILAR